MATLLTGIQPSGPLHIGNYLGAVKQFVELQKEYDAYFMIADLHALTSVQDPKALTSFTLDLAAAMLAAGLDPQKTTLFVQSAVPAHTELTWIFSTLTPLGELERMTQYKEKSDRQGQNAGLLTYPILQACDILLYNPEFVPVGEDQVQHVELTRIIARKFNSRYGETFKEPKTLLTKTARVMALNEPQKKMSKSIPGSAIGLDDTPDQIRKVIMSAVTDTSPTGEMSAGVKNLFGLLSEFAPDKVAEFESAHQSGTIRYADLKSTFAEDIIATLEPIQAKKKQILANPEELLSILKTGNHKANQVAAQKLLDIRHRVGLLN
jgi:tryptophanyl-tRNA synthetase